MLHAVLLALSVSCASPQAQRTRALMQDPIVPASDAIFGAVIYTNGQLAASPTTDAEWARLNQRTRNLVESASTLKTLAPADNPAEWIKQAEALATASEAASQAAEGRSLESVLEAGSRIYDTCTACHAAYVPQD